MTVVVDTSMAVALYDADDDHHTEASAWIAESDDDLVVTPLVVAELDHVVPRRVIGELLRDFEVGAYVVRWWADALTETLAVARARPDIGLTDASLVALAGRLRTNRIATFDHRHFRTLNDTAGRPFRLLPADPD